MAKKKLQTPPKDDIPAWFMTYSDVITLLMTFFILLLTFATTEPERFDQVTKTINNAQAGKGMAGQPLKNKPKDSWVARVRPPSARIATRGATMPPITQAPSRESFGKGLQALDDQERKHNEMSAHHFDLDFSQLFDRQNEITPLGVQILRMLAKQLTELPFEASFETLDAGRTELISKLMVLMTAEFGTRPGQLSMSVVKRADLTSGQLRIVVRRFLQDPQE